MNKRIPLVLGLLFVLIAVWLLITPTQIVRLWLERLDHLGYDFQLRTRLFTERITPKTPIAIIDIDDDSLKAEGRWPWPRSKLGNLVDQLRAQGASVIVFDIIFSEKETNIAEKLSETLSQKNLLDESLKAVLKKNEPYFNEDLNFAESLKNSKAVLSLIFLPESQYANTLPKPLLTLTKQEENELEITQGLGFISNIQILQQAAKGEGFINIFPDGDGLVRHAPLIMRYKNKIYPSLALQAVLTYLNTNIKLITPLYDDSIQLEGIIMGNLQIPTDARGKVLIPFIGKSYTFPYYSASDVLHGKVPKDAFAGKIVFVGTSATGLGDLQATAAENPFPGVEIQATIANGILLNNFSYIPAWSFGAQIFFTLLFGLIASFLFLYVGPRTLSAIILLFPLILILLNYFFWQQTGIVLSLLVPLMLVLSIALLNLIYGYLFETRKRERLKEMFGQYVPASHIDQMLKTTSDYALGGEDREMSVLFADIRQFTTISEGMSAHDLVEMLNTIFTPLTEAIFKHRGTIDKYVGDLIMAFWGAPLKDKNHARHAIETALDMQKTLKELVPTLAERKWPPIRMGIGISSGIMSVGDMGSRYRRNYTVLGDEVNLASRIESLTKFYGVNIIVTEETKKGQTNFIFRKLDRVRVKGKKRGIELFEVMGRKKDLSREIENELSVFHQILDFYAQRRFEEAKVLIDKLQQNDSDVKVYQIYSARINAYLIHPPSEYWDATYEHENK
jgi:adenylate cyclase